MPKLVYTIDQFCRRYRIARATFYREVKCGRLCAVKRGHRTFITIVEARRWYQKRQHVHIIIPCRSDDHECRKRFSVGGLFKFIFRKSK